MKNLRVIKNCVSGDSRILYIQYVWGCVLDFTRLQYSKPLGSSLSTKTIALQHFHIPHHQLKAIQDVWMIVEMYFSLVALNLKPLSLLTCFFSQRFFFHRDRNQCLEPILLDLPCTRYPNSLDIERKEGFFRSVNVQMNSLISLYIYEALVLL